ncbi:hypothetical protein ABBQ38_007352 [Trebouxia sp. C0009 RCD-2024]
MATMLQATRGFTCNLPASATTQPCASGEEATTTHGGSLLCGMPVRQLGCCAREYGEVAMWQGRLQKSAKEGVISRCLLLVGMVPIQCSPLGQGGFPYNLWELCHGAQGK